MRSRRKKPMAEINVVPYIDVMLVLLLIFMITTPMLTQGVKIDLPKAEAEALTNPQHEPIIVTVNKEGQFFLNLSSKPTEPIAASEMATRVAAELLLAKESGEQRAVLVKGDEKVNYGSVVTAMVILQRAGAEKVGLMTDPPEKKA